MAMAKIYARKIKNGEINSATGSAWELADVPAKWRDAVAAMLESETTNGL
jgi:hypothetical protein